MPGDIEFGKVGWMIKKDLLRLWRHKIQLVSLVIFPIIMIAFCGYGMGGSVENTPIVIVKQSDGPVTDQVIDAIKSDETYDIKDIISDADEAKRMVEDGEISAAIILPSDFESADSKNAVLYIDSSNQMVTSSVVPSAQQLFSSLSEQLSLEESTNNNTSTLTSVAQSIQLNVNKIYGDIEYIDYLLPGTLGMIMFMSSMMTMGNSIAGERERGELSRLFMTPTSVSTVIFGKIISQLVRQMIQATILLVVASLLFDVTIKGSIILLFVIMILSVLCFVGFGMMISATSKTQEDYMQMVMPIAMPSMFISGIFFPTTSMPWILQELAHILPLTYVADALRSIMLQGGGLASVALDIVVLLGFTLLFFVVGVVRFDREI
ncbi:MAG: ABC transporter permease [Methanosphaera sp.]|nr:ABC transporter permease [Methanosphaera sp.]